MFNPKEVAFALVTFYPKWYTDQLKNISQTDKIRGDLALQFINQALSLGFQVVVVDGKSSRNFQNKLKTFSKLHILKRQGIKRAPAKRKSLLAASKLPKVKTIILCEAEKVSILKNIRQIIEPILENSVDIVIPKRQENLFKKTYLAYMYTSETEGNRLYNQQLQSHNIIPKNISFDWFFGPRALSNKPKILSLFRKKFMEEQNTISEYSDPEELSNILFFPIVTALKKGYNVKNMGGSFFLPPISKVK